MSFFEEHNLKNFVANYWQKKPLVIRQAFPAFINPLTADELAGLAMEEEFESRIVIEKPRSKFAWQLKNGPFSKRDFKHLPKTNWTLLVQGVDRFIPQVTALLDYFDFLPQWRIDDLMISYAVDQGSVGPHYDNYDVFLYQAKGSRKWSLTTQNCHPANCLKGLDLRIMEEFIVEEDYFLEEGDMLYLPPHVGHYGIAVGESITYSFGYRSYQALELWENFGSYIAEKSPAVRLYQDPEGIGTKETSELDPATWQQAKDLMQGLLDNKQELQNWFGCFATRLDEHAEEFLPLPLEKNELIPLRYFIEKLQAPEQGLLRHPLCRFVYQLNKPIALFINGAPWPVQGVSEELVKLVANKRFLNSSVLSCFLNQAENQHFLYELWSLSWLEFTL